MFEWIAFLIALLAGLYKLWEKEEITYTYIFVVVLLSGFISLVIAVFGGFLFPTEAVAITTQTALVNVLLGHFFSAFIGAIITPIVKLIAKVKLA